MKNINTSAIIRVLVYASAALAIMAIGCSKDTNPVDSGKEISDISVTGNIKETPYFFSIETMSRVASPFDLIFHIVNRSPDIGLNSGPHGSAGVTALDLGEVDFSAEADTGQEFSTDSADSAVIGDTWYSYDFMTHTISSLGHVYLIRSVDYRIYKLRIDGYTQNVWTITYSAVDDNGKPLDIKTAEVSATDTEPDLFSLGAGSSPEPEVWDLAFLTIPLFVAELGGYISNPAIRINSTAGVEVAKVVDKDYETLNSVPDGLTFSKDGEENLAVGDTVFDYNPQNHRLTPPEVVYILKSSSGKYAKLKVTSYYHPETGESGFVNYRVASFN